MKTIEGHRETGGFFAFGRTANNKSPKFLFDSLSQLT